MLKASLLALILLAITIVQTQKMRHAVIFLGAFSLTISFVYLLYNAPDVALAEAIIGSTISTILYLVALQKYKIFTFYYCVSEDALHSKSYNTSDHQHFIKIVEKFCAKQEIEPQIIYTVESFDHIIETHQYALILQNDSHGLTIWGHPENYKLDALEVFFKEHPPLKAPIHFIKVEEVIE